MQVFGGFLLWFREKKIIFVSNGGSNEIIEEYVEIMQKQIKNPLMDSLKRSIRG